MKLTNDGIWNCSGNNCSSILLQTSDIRLLLSLCPDNIPEWLIKCNEVVNRYFHNRIKAHENFNAEQKWCVGIKCIGT